MKRHCYTHMHVHTCIHTHTHTQCTHTRMHTRIQISTRVHTQANMKPCHSGEGWCGGCKAGFKQKDKKSPCVATTTKACENTCQGKTCDYWGLEQKYTCAVVEKDYGCSCTGCKCVLDKMLKACKDFKYKGDGNCDDGNNNAGCLFDGGQCCDRMVGDTSERMGVPC